LLSKTSGVRSAGTMVTVHVPANSAGMSEHPAGGLDAGLGVDTATGARLGVALGTSWLGFGEAGAKDGLQPVATSMVITKTASTSDPFTVGLLGLGVATASRRGMFTISLPRVLLTVRERKAAGAFALPGPLLFALKTTAARWAQGMGASSGLTPILRPIQGHPGGCARRKAA
jgi:hypothetical protein